MSGPTFSPVTLTGGFWEAETHSVHLPSGFAGDCVGQHGFFSGRAVLQQQHSPACDASAEAVGSPHASARARQHHPCGIARTLPARSAMIMETRRNMRSVDPR